MVHGLLALVVGVAGLVASAEPEAVEPVGAAAAAGVEEPGSASRATYEDGRALLVALGKRDREIETLTGDVRLTGIQVLQGDTQQRSGKLMMRTVKPRTSEEPGSATRATGEAVRMYAVAFDALRLGTRQEAIDEEYVFDGRWLVERIPSEKQFIKREIVPAGQVLDPMDLMRDAPFWVSVGDDADRVLRDYDADVLPAEDGLTVDAAAPELASLARLVEGTVQLKLTPKEGSAAEDDWEAVRIWFTRDTLLPRLYVKTAWTGDLQIAELFGVRVNEGVEDGAFDTTAPAPGSGWQVQISPWRGEG
jgi:hypothetical protein